jgi:hypothetical protein
MEAPLRMRFAKWVVCGFLLIPTACSSTDWVLYDVDSEPRGAAVEVNGQTLGNTPCEIKLQKVSAWVGLVNGGYDYGRTPTYAIKAYPPLHWEGASL